jgi:uncharacterized OB-fold protein
MPELLFEVGADGAMVLRGGRCRSCRAPQFPRPEACGVCGGPTDELRLSGNGASLWGWTSVQAAPPGYDGPVPYGFGVVELPEGLRVITRLTEPDPANLHFGQPMRLVPDVVARDADGNDVVTWAFAPDAESRP